MDIVVAVAVLYRYLSNVMNHYELSGVSSNRPDLYAEIAFEIRERLRNHLGYASRVRQLKKSA